MGIKKRRIWCWVWIRRSFCGKVKNAYYSQWTGVVGFLFFVLFSLRRCCLCNDVTLTEKDSPCIAPMVWAFLSTTVQLHSTHRKVEGGERDTRLVHVNEANSCFARGYCVSQAAQGEGRLSSPPPSSPIAPPPWLNLCDFQRPRPKARMASI
jgi:hypothetical protein